MPAIKEERVLKLNTFMSLIFICLIPLSHLLQNTLDCFFFLGHLAVLKYRLIFAVQKSTNYFCVSM